MIFKGSSTSRPPPPDADDDDLIADPPKSFLLDCKPFIDDRTNATVAHALLRHPVSHDPMALIRASLFIPRPPRVSHVVLDCVGTLFTNEPRVVASDAAGLVLLSIAVEDGIRSKSEFYMYRRGAPSLDLVPQPDGYRDLVDRYRIVALLSSSSPNGGGYRIAALTAVKARSGEFELRVFCSDTKTWALKRPFLPPDAACLVHDKEFNFLVYKAIPLGDNVVAFVDLFNGVLFCDVLHGGDRPELLHVPLPHTAPRQPPTFCSQPLIPCDVAVDMSDDMVVHIKCIQVEYCPDTSPWKATTWITTFKAGTSPWSRIRKWHKEHKLLDPAKLSVAHGVSLAGLLPDDEALDEEQLQDEEKPTLGDLFVDTPLFSLNEDGVVCFIAKSSFTERQMWVMAVDLAKGELRGVVPLPANRYTWLSYATISSHRYVAAPTGSHCNVAAPTGAKGALKQLGEQPESYPHNKKNKKKLKKKKQQQQQKFFVSSSVGEQEEKASCVGSSRWG